MEIVEQVRQSVAKTLKISADEITPDTRLDEIGLNSLEVMEVIFELEEKLGIEIPLEAQDLAAGKTGGEKRSDALPFETVADVASAIRPYLGARPA